MTGCHCRDFVGHDPDNRSSTSPHTATYVTIATLQRAQALLVSGPGQTGEVISFEQQERWVWARARRSLDPSVAGFGARGLLAYLDSPGIAVTVLPADVLGQLIEFTDDLPGLVLPDRFDGITGNGVSLLSDVTTTSTPWSASPLPTTMADGVGSWLSIGVGVSRLESVPPPATNSIREETSRRARVCSGCLCSSTLFGSSSTLRRV